MLSWNEMHARNEHASQVPAFVEIPVGIKNYASKYSNRIRRIEDIRMWGVILMYMSTGRLHFFPHVKQRESRSSLDLSATIFIHVSYSIRHPSIPLENCLKHLTYRRGVRIAEKTQIHRIEKRDFPYMWWLILFML